MWIEKTKSGKYKYTEQYTDYMTGKKKRVSVTLEKNTAAARRTAAETLVRMMDKKQSLPPEKVELTLSQLIDKYREYQKRTTKESTYKRNYFACEAFKRILGPDVLVDRLTANYIKECFLRTGRAAGTLNEYRTRLIALLHWAFENDYISDVSFTRKFKPFKDRSAREKIQDKYLEPEEVNRLLQAMQNEKWKMLTQFLILSGLRIGEAISLTLSDIDYKEHCIHVTKTYDSINRIVTTPKTACSIRDVYMQPELEGVCRSIILHKKMESLARGYRTDLFISNSKGGYLNYYSYNKYLKENAEKAIGRQITPHALRHTHASLLLACGVSVDTISRRFGHENSAVTREIYLHVTKKLVERDNAQIKDLKII